MDYEYKKQLLELVNSVESANKAERIQACDSIRKMIGLHRYSIGLLTMATAKATVEATSPEHAVEIIHSKGYGNFVMSSDWRVQYGEGLVEIQAQIVNGKAVGVELIDEAGDE
jgi:hypothetical protein